ncbi:Conserved oligomeric Golgi complex subunit 6 [Daldinia childiae]|uniref:Conserved oligomeric Golgi complex subunit 6 n=1 Tax=Daldinia childiae TaxID=326645 RepID=UPI0014481B75|nr:Conserved oligomeric Golgi complex subunit 6 [Daldinia childiae]KAF3061610.1 Conserved oligomeric Golgi complex subunit 6 [Daldinia childiae]
MAKNISAPSNSIFLINCLLAAQTAFQPFQSFTRTRLEGLRSTIADHSARLVESQYAFFRAESSLEPLFTVLSPLSDARSSDVATLPSLPELRPEALARAAQGLDDFLPSAVMDALENVKNLHDARLAREITEEAADRFCADFEHVEELLVAADEAVEERRARGDGGGGEERVGLRAMFPRTTGEIRVLLS